MDRESQDGPRPGKPLVEWIFGGASACLVAGLALYFGYQAMVGGARPPALRVVVERVEAAAQGTLVRVAVTNDGDDAASGVGVTASQPERSIMKRIEFDYVAGGSTRHGAFLFIEPVAAETLRVEIDGYSAP